MSDAANDHPLDQLSSYLDDELAVVARARIDRHLASCPACREHLESLRRLTRAIASEPVPAPPDGLEGAVLRRLDAAAVVPYRRRFVVPASIAATIAAVGLLVVVAWKQGGPRVAPSPEQAPKRASGYVESGTSETQKELTAPERVATPASPRHSPPLASSAVTAEPAAKPQEPEPKAKRDDAVLDKVAAERVKSRERGLADAADAKDEMAPVSATSAAAPARVEDAVASGGQPRNELNRPAVWCAKGVVDSGIEAVWNVADPADAARSLALLASVHGGRVEPQASGRVDRSTVVIPAERFVAFAGAARSIGVKGFDGATPTAAEGCVRQHIRLVPPSPR